MSRKLVPDLDYLARATWRSVRERAAAVPGRVRAMPSALRDPVVQADALQVGKTVVAAVLAWVLAVRVFDLPQPFLAPWSAMLTVHATVYRSLSRGVQSVLATVLGVLVSFGAVQLLGLSAATLAVGLFAALALGRLGLVRAEGVTVATTVLFVITTGYDQPDPVLLARVLDAALGIAAGVVVNLVVLPPLNDASARRHVDRIDVQMGCLLADMATEMGSQWTTEQSGDWIARTRAMDDDLDHAWQVVRQAQESTRYNPRGRSPAAGNPSGYADVLIRLEDGVAEVRSIARTVHSSTLSAQEWEPGFREPWVELLAEAGRRVADTDADVAPLRADVDALTRRLSSSDLPAQHWPVYGALLTNLRNVLDIVDDVATAQPVRT